MMNVMKFAFVFATIVSAFAQFAVSPLPPRPLPLPDSVAVEKNVSYDSHPQTVLDVLTSKSMPAGKRPAMIFIHGGGWTGGTKEGYAANFGAPFVEKGFVVFNVEYRLAKVATAPAAVTDVLKAAEWVRRNAARYNVDSKKIIVAGSSAGAHLALMVGMTPKSAGLGPVGKVAAIVNFWGITDVNEQLNSTNPTASREWVPGESPDQRELARRVSPMTWVRKSLPPVLTVHGDEDKVVAYEQGTKLTSALIAAGVDAELITRRGVGHAYGNDMVPLFPQIFEWLARRGVN